MLRRKKKKTKKKKENDDTKNEEEKEEENDDTKNEEENTDKKESEKTARDQRAATRRANSDAPVTPMKMNEPDAIKVLRNYFKPKDPEPLSIDRYESMEQLLLHGHTPIKSEGVGKDTIVKCFERTYNDGGIKQGQAELYYPDKDFLKDYRKEKWVDIKKKRMKYRPNWFLMRENKKDSFNTLQDSFIGFRFNKEKLGKNLQNEMKWVRSIMEGVKWGEIEVYPAMYDEEKHGIVLLFGKFEIGKSLDRDELTLDDISTLTDNAKFGQHFTTANTKMYRGALLHLGQAIANNTDLDKKSASFRESLEFEFLEKIKLLVYHEEQKMPEEVQQGHIVKAAHLFIQKLDQETLELWEKNYCEMYMIRALMCLDLPAELSPMGNLTGLKFVFPSEDEEMSKDDGAVGGAGGNGTAGDDPVDTTADAGEETVTTLENKQSSVTASGGDDAQMGDAGDVVGAGGNGTAGDDQVDTTADAGEETGTAGDDQVDTTADGGGNQGSADNVKGDGDIEVTHDDKGEEKSKKRKKGGPSEGGNTPSRRSMRRRT